MFNFNKNFLNNRELYFNNDNYKYIKTKHSWHLVDPSPWPLVAALGGFVMTSGGVLYMHNYIGGGNMLFTGVLMVLFVMYTWWRDIVREATFEEQHTFSVQRGMRLGMILFIVSEIMFFFAFFWAFFHSSLSPVYNIGGTWPPVAITVIPTFGIPLTNTFLLLSSSSAFLTIFKITCIMRPIGTFIILFVEIFKSILILFSLTIGLMIVNDLVMSSSIAI